MVCPKCGSTQTLTVRLFDQEKGKQLIGRIYHCNSCQHVWIRDCGHCLTRDKSMKEV